MGKGDIKSRRGKIRNGSYGVRRRKKKVKPEPQVVVKAVKKKTKK
jgi:ribosomal small subunit protein bTHX